MAHESVPTPVHTCYEYFISAVTRSDCHDYVAHIWRVFYAGRIFYGISWATVYKERNEGDRADIEDSNRFEDARKEGGTMKTTVRDKPTTANLSKVNKLRQRGVSREPHNAPVAAYLARHIPLASRTKRMYANARRKGVA